MWVVPHQNVYLQNQDAVFMGISVKKGWANFIKKNYYQQQN
jgi:hypothetical protein